MKRFFSKTMLLLTGCFSLSLLANAQERLDCESILASLETGEIQDGSYYDKCGFDDSLQVWTKWAGYVSEKKMKRAVFEICVRYPEHEYHNLYCEKALLWGIQQHISAKERCLLRKEIFNLDMNI